MAFSLVVPRRPPSGNKGKNKKFQEFLRAEAMSRNQGREPLWGRLYCRIVWFHSVSTTQDVDNIAKNILDSLKDVVFRDDVSVVRCLLAKIDTREDIEISQGLGDSGSYETLRSHLENEEANLVYIEVGQASGQRVQFGPIEEKDHDSA